MSFDAFTTSKLALMAFKSLILFFCFADKNIQRGSFRVMAGKGNQDGKMVLSGGKLDWVVDNVSSVPDRAIVWRVVETVLSKWKQPKMVSENEFSVLEVVKTNLDVEKASFDIYEALSF